MEVPLLNMDISMLRTLLEGKKNGYLLGNKQLYKDFIS